MKLTNWPTVISLLFALILSTGTALSQEKRSEADKAKMAAA